MRHISVAAATTALAVAGAAFAADPAPAPTTPVEKPSPDAVKAVWNFYLKGKGQGVVLVEAKLCLEIAKEGPNKSDCAKEVGPEGVKAGTVIQVWQSYLVPQGDSLEDLTLQLKLGDQVRETRDIKVNGASIRYRSWNALRIPKAGKWTITLMRGAETLKSIEVVAK